MSNVINMVAFQIAWFACVVGAARGMPWLGIVVTAIVVALFVLTESRRGIAPANVATRERSARRARNALLFVLGTACAGALLEFVGSRSGVYTFASVDAARSVAVVDLAWMACLWAAFATTLPLSLAWLSRRKAVGLLFGAVGGPLAFVAGEKLGAIRLGESRTMALVSLAVIWAIAVPLLGSIARRVLPVGSRQAES
ncbi:MAG: DUF2878 domain-containing protein [Planctomycetes bacterium]|nr:DUF2878 domain-containing protein [Planctomycetota bacterium]MCB9890365.1 DUF2878 domain-containing protein [Planctomycetota bacterium]MCB9918183.1 DUF2878 domain-containing protein [Planctomycetota bacterium]